MAITKLQPFNLDSAANYTFANITATNANLGNAATANFFIGNGSLLTGITVSAGNTIVNGNSNVTVIANGNVTTSVAGNSNIFTVTGTGVNVSGTLNSTGNANVGNLGATDVLATTLGGSLTTAAQPNITSIGTLSSLSVIGNITSGNANLGNAASANYFIGNFYGTANSATTAGTVTTAAQPNITSVGTLTGLTSTGTANLIGASNVSLGPVGNVKITGGSNGQYLQTDGSGVLSWSTVTSGSTSNISNGNSNVDIPSANGNVNISAVGNANIVVVTGTGVNVAGTLNVTGNATVGNIVTSGSGGNVSNVNVISANTFVASGNVTANNFIAGNGTGGNITNANVISANTFTASGNITSGNANLGNAASANYFIGNFYGTANSATTATTAGTVTTAAQPNITSVGSLLGLTVSNSSGVVNLSNTANVSLGVVGNVRITGGSNGQYLQTDGTGTLTWSTVTSGSTSNISNGNSNVNIPSANGNVNISAVGNANIVVVTGTGANIAGTLNVTGNATVGNIVTSGSGGNVSNVNVISANTFIASGNITANNFIAGNGTGGNISNANVISANTFTASGNITAGNANLGNAVTANYFIGNFYGTANSASSATTAGTVTTAAQPNITSVGTLTGLVVSGTGSFSGNVNLNSFNITNLATPNASTDAATKQYVDDVAQGLNVHDAVAAATTDTLANVTSGTITYNNGSSGVGANLTTTGTFNLIDGVNVQTSGTRILVKNEANAVYNGIYTWSNATVITRATDYNSVPEVEAGDFVFVTGGTLYDNTGWVQTSTVSAIGTVGNNIEFTQFSGAGTYQAGTGLTLTGSTFSVNANQSQVTNVGTLGNLTVTGNATVGNIVTSGSGGNIGNANVISANTFIASGNITSGNANLGNAASANYFIGNFYGTANSATTAGTVTTAAQPNITSIGTLTSLAVTGNITSGNANLGNLVTANFFTGNGSLLTGITVSAGNTIVNGNSNVLVAANGNVTTSVAGNANILIVTGTGVNVAGTLNATGNTTVGNLFSSGSGGNISNVNVISANTFVASGNITAGNILTSGSGGNLSNINVVSANTFIASGNANLGNAASANYFIGNFYGTANSATTAGTVTTAAQPNITSVGTLTGITSTGTANLTGASNVALGPVGNVKITGGSNGQYLQTDGTGTLTWSTVAGGSSSNISNGNSNVNIPSANGNVNISSAGNANILIVTGTGVNIAGTLNTTGNTTVGNLFSTGSGGNISNVNVISANTFIASGNITAGNILTSGSGGNLSNINVVSANTFIASANITAGNANLGNLIIANYITSTLTTNAQPNITSVGTLTGLTTTGTANLTGASNVSLGPVGNVKITGGSNGQYLQTDGTGTLTWSTVAGGATSNISNGNSNVNIPSANGNVNISAVGNANILIVTGTGVNVAGTLNATGNTTVGNLFSTGSGGNISNVNVISANTFIASGNITAGNILTSGSGGNLSNINVVSANTFIASGNITSGNANLGNNVTANFFTGNLYGTANLATYATTANAVAGGNVSGQVANALISGTVYTNAQPNITSVGTLTSLTVTGNVTGGNLVTAGKVYSADFINGGTGIYLSAGPSGYINFFTTGGDKASISDTGNIIASNVIANSTVFAVTANVSGNVNAGNANLGNNVTANFFTGNGSLLTGITVSAGNTIVNGNSNVLVSANGNVTTSVAGNANILVVTGTGVNVAGTLNVTGNATVGNIVTSGSGGNVSNVNVISANTFIASGNVTGGNLITGGLVSATGNVVTSANVVTDLIVGKTSGITITATGTNQNINLTPTGTGTVNVGNFIISNVATPVASTDAATKQYVDDVAQGLHTHDSCNAATQTTLASISGGTVTYNNGTSGVGATLTTTGTYTTIDGVTLSVGMRILVKNEVTTANNGIYDVTSSTVLTRSADFDTPVEMAGGDFTFVTAGTLYDNTGWVMPDPVTTVGTSPVVWVQFSGAGTYQAGTGLTLTGAVFSITNTAVTAGSYGNGDYNATFTVNGQGQLTAAANVALTPNAANLSGTTLSATVVNSSLTSLGTLGSLAVTSNITAGNVYANSGTIGASLLGGALTTAAQPNITSVGTLSSLDVTGTTTSGNFATAGNITASTLISNVTTGTAPFTVTSTTRVGNLNVTYANVSDFGAVTTQSTGIYYPTFVNGNTTANYAFGSNTLFSANLANGAFIATTFVGALSGAATTAGTVTTAAQPNITSVGTLSSLDVTGTTTSGNFATAGNITASFLISNVATGTAPFTVTSTTRVGNLNVAYANVADTINVAAGTGNNFLIFANAATGNIAQLTSTGLIANLSNNSVTATTFVGALSGAATTAGTVTTAAQPNITSVGSLTGLTVSNVTGDVTFTNTATVSLGAVANLRISGGSNGQVLTTNGSSGLTWTTVSGGGGGGSNIANGTSNVNIPTADGNVNTSVGGTANVFVVTSTGANVSGNLTASNISAGAGAGGSITGANLISANYFTGQLSNGNSNINIASVNGNVSISAIGNANVLVVTGTGANISGTANITGNTVVGNLTAGAGSGGSITGANYISANYFYGTLTSGASSQPNLTSLGTLAGLNVSNASANMNFTVNLANFANTSNVYLGAVSNVHIANGTANYFLQTNGAGDLTWAQAIPIITDSDASGSTFYPVYATSTSGGFLTAGITSAKLQFVPSTGQLTVQDLNTLSDATLKENPEAIENPIEILMQLFGMGFNWVDSKKKSYGLMAQMVEKILPELVSTNAQGKKAVNYIPIIAFLIEAVKKQQEDIEALKKR